MELHPDRTCEAAGRMSEQDSAIGEFVSCFMHARARAAAVYSVQFCTALLVASRYHDGTKAQPQMAPTAQRLVVATVSRMRRTVGHVADCR